MSKYIFSTDEFGTSETGFHLLRSNFNYETIDYKDITLLEIDRGKLIANWVLVLVIGIGLVGFSIYYTFLLIGAFNNPSIREIYIEQILIPVLPLLLGGFCIYSSLRTGIVIRMERAGRKTSYPLTEIVKKQQLKDFIASLKSNKLTVSKLKIYID